MSIELLREKDHGAQLMFWAMAYKVSDALFALSQTGVLEVLAKEPCDSNQLNEITGLDPAALSVLLYILSDAGVLERDGEDVFSLPASAAKLLPVIRLEDKMRQWHQQHASLKNALTTGKGSDPMDQNPDADTVSIYKEAMANANRAVALHMRRFLLPSINGPLKIVDLGGADGSLLCTMSRTLKAAEFCVVDRAHMRSFFDKRIESIDSPQRFTFIGGDLVEPATYARALSTATAVIVSNVIHLLNDNQIGTLCQTLYENLPKGARILIYDQMPSSEKAPLDVPRLMTLDWLNCGTLFKLTAEEMTLRLTKIGFQKTQITKLSGLPGTLITCDM